MSIFTTYVSSLYLVTDKIYYEHDWDLKSKITLGKTIPDIEYYFQKFLFVFNGQVINSENLGDYI